MVRQKETKQQVLQGGDGCDKTWVKRSRVQILVGQDFLLMISSSRVFPVRETLMRYNEGDGLYSKRARGLVKIKKED